ncbi:MAG: DNA polymerase IV [Lentisphaeria bacterium]|nr:DNA polymerase IV [Lentisphaeria bacterium]
MRKIIHIDMDAFFASVEQRDRPELRGRPVLVGGAPQRRGVVSTCSYEARRFGVHSAMPTRTALKLCPQAILIEPDFRRYKAASELIRREFRRLTPLVEPVSIDEAYLDVTAICPTLDDAAAAARQLQERIAAVTRLTASAGVSFNKFLAKTASDCRKPAGLTVISPEAAGDFLAALPVEKFHGIGQVGARRLRAINVRTGTELRQLSPEILRGLFGKAGLFYYGIVRGIDDRPVELEADPKSISREQTLSRDLNDLRGIRILLRTLARKVIRRADAREMTGRTVFIKLKYADFRTVTRSVVPPAPPSSGAELGRIAVRLLDKTEAGRTPIRLAGVGITQLMPVREPVFEQLQIPFFSPEKT